MKFTEKTYKEVIKKSCGGLMTEYGGKKVDWGKAWEKVDYVEVFKNANGIDPTKSTREELFKKAKELKLDPEKNLGKGTAY